MVRLDIELIRDDKQSIVLELVDSDGLTIDPAALERIEMWVKPPFQDKLYPDISVRPADAFNGLGKHLLVTFGHGLLAKQMWTQARYGIVVTHGSDGPKTVIGGKIIRIY
ncbi:MULTISPECIES: hypothetical protein [unclassified Neisseria]|uniref:hypothetical protein n=1 Tax=unclassified Neisseria TaxID=2623750 RepID=UPI001072A9C8|nr:MULTISPECIES: hypothetical protein [unclassified Neisseria]MBF0802889.1 hypothetical protein [Neisseria sp. 19428wB4_WF04]TFU44426.1 hypothetical protein E4T99_00650 [Neisseria sp. WF04]